MTVTERFLDFVKYDTQSDELTDMTPSSPGQMEFAGYLKTVLEGMGLQDVDLDDNGYLMATLPANTDRQIPTIGFIAHMDTSPDMSGKHVKPRIVKDYDGGVIKLNEEYNLDPAEFPELKNYVGQDLIVTDGTTLLGADDKAGIAEILTAVAWLQQHPEVKHGKIRVGFNPDEEIGLGAHKFDVQKFGCDFAYTMDGGAVGELEFENFNAAQAKVTIKGRNVHPGYAKHKMVNSIRVAGNFIQMLPRWETPEHTEGYEGFFHLDSMQGTCDEAMAGYIIRDHDRNKFEAKKTLFATVCDFLSVKYGKGTVTAEIKDSYYNMKEMVLPHIHLVDNAKTAMQKAGVTPIVTPIRGGTDGARLSYEGLPCPNLFTGGYNFHGRYEYIPYEDMEKALEVVLNLVDIYKDR